MITAKEMREIADKTIQEKENSILEQHKDIMQYIEQSIQDQALNGKKFVNLHVDISSTNYVFPNKTMIPQKEFYAILEKLEQEGFSVKFYYYDNYKRLLIEWKK